MPEMFRKSDPVLFILFLAAFIFLNILHLFTGYADNYDFVRNATFLFEKPYGFSAMVPQVGTEEWSRRFNTQWSDKWVFLADWPDMSNLINISSYKFYLLLQAKITYYLMGTPEYYFISFGSVVSRIILISSVVGIFFHLRNAMPFYAFWLFGIMSFIFFLDARWIGFLNSLYEEQMAVIFFH